MSICVFTQNIDSGLKCGCPADYNGGITSTLNRYISKKVLTPNLCTYVQVRGEVSFLITTKTVAHRAERGVVLLLPLLLLLVRVEGSLEKVLERLEGGGWSERRLVLVLPDTEKKKVNKKVGGKKKKKKSEIIQA